ncbi:DUF3017 domain-containing protein [Nocardioides sp. Kera G14]|uniref:DUF3017 domain-containing protein n=1 Tax=Nocardioides sp. Kera G14 TaxID=2884264 RepID=UPI001D0F73BA|nr:DUF3017 domain-containing protein [Nocardioides sp. Kera G14]UDY25333.1 DUF3017 domain-containing protein [Nocardioides sp. Kera G14]
MLEDERGAEPQAPQTEVPVEEERRYPSTIGGAFYLAILGLAIAGIVVAAFGHWEMGVQMLAAGLVAAAVLRLVLPSRDAGMLAVRHRFVDAGLLAAVGVALWLLVRSIPSVD